MKGRLPESVDVHASLRHDCRCETLDGPLLVTTCGTTRSVSLIFSCDFSAAFFANPIGFVLIAALLRIGILGSVPKNQLTEALDSRATEIVLLILFFIGGFWHSISKF